MGQRSLEGCKVVFLCEKRGKIICLANLLLVGQNNLETFRVQQMLPNHLNELIRGIGLPECLYNNEWENSRSVPDISDLT